MARVVKEQSYAARRRDILDAAQRLVYSKGYELMTIQDILDALGISKGAFYHYFDSKGAVLEALIERMVVDEVIPILTGIVTDPGLSGIDKLHRYYDTSARWKSAHRALIMELMRVWIADENAIVRQKLTAMSIKFVTPLLTKIIRQGIQEGDFFTDFPDQVSKVVFYILLGMSDTLIDLLLASEVERNGMDIENTVETYIDALTDATERVLGARKGSLNLIDMETLMEWFVPTANLQPATLTS